MYYIANLEVAVSQRVFRVELNLDLAHYGVFRVMTVYVLIMDASYVSANSLMRFHFRARRDV